MVRFIENKKTDSGLGQSSADGMIKRRVSELTNYSNISVSDAVDRLTAEAKGKSIQCHHGHYMGSYFMEARYSLMKVSGGELRFLDSRNLNNRMSIYIRDVAKAEIGEDTEVDFVTFRFDLKDKTFISVAPMN